MSGFRRLSSAIIVAGGLLLSATPLFAQDTSAKQPGLWLTTSFPVVTERIGEDAVLPLSLANSNLPPARVTFKVEGLPSGWTSELTGSGKVVGAAIATTDQSQSLSLKVTAPKDVKPGVYSFKVLGTTDSGQTLELPISMTYTEAAPDKVTLTPKLPALRGTPNSSFDFEVAIKNDSPEDTTLNLVADSPAGFTTTFKEQYGSQELTSLPFKAGEQKSVKVSVKPQKNVAAGQYPVTVGASNAKVQGEAQLLLDITGQPAISLTTQDGRLSGQAEAGKEQTFNFTLVNSGTAAAQNVTVSASAPSGWKAEADPKTVDVVQPNSPVAVAIHITPSDKAIAGDYMVSVNASGDGVSEHADYRVTVTTSTIWGIVGLLVIAAAVLVLGFAVTRYGRR